MLQVAQPGPGRGSDHRRRLTRIPARRQDDGQYPGRAQQLRPPPEPVRTAVSGRLTGGGCEGRGGDEQVDRARHQPPATDSRAAAETGGGAGD